MYQSATPASGSSVSPLQLGAAGLLSTASELAAGLVPPQPATVALPVWPTLPTRHGWVRRFRNRETAKRVAQLGLGLLVAPHLLTIGSSFVGQAGRPSLRPPQAVPAAGSPEPSVPVPTMTDSGANYGG